MSLDMTLAPRYSKSRRNLGVLALVVVTMVLVSFIYNPIDCRNILKILRQDRARTTQGSNVKWVNFSSNVFRLHVFNALYDDRPSLLSDPVVRIIAVSDAFTKFKALKGAQLYCILHYESATHVLLMNDEPKAIGSLMWDLNKQKAIGYLYTCPSVNGTIPIAVAISTAQDDKFSTLVPVTIPNKPEKQCDFIICTHVAHGLGLDPYQVTEWMEIQKILGVSLVGVYILSAPESVIKVFRHYAAEGFVELRETNYIYASANDTDHEYMLHLTPSINDCFYRHMYEFRRIVIMDFDEVIMPRYHNTLSDLVTYLGQMQAAKKSTMNVNYGFRNSYFFLNLPPDEKTSSKLTVLRFRRNVEVSPDGYYVKSIINPQSCTHVNSHYCWGVTANYSKYRHTASVDPQIALKHHYRICPFRKEKCNDMMRNSTQDDIMLRLRDTLTKNFRDKVKAIMGNEV